MRIDKWLWAARFYKTRQLAVKAIKNSQISINKSTIKPATNLKVGELVVLKRGTYQLEVIVDTLLEKRGSATVAQTMYHETTESIEAREILRQQLAAQPKIDIDRKKPNKYALRETRALKRS